MLAGDECMLQHWSALAAMGDRGALQLSLIGAFRDRPCMCTHHAFGWWQSLVGTYDGR